MSATTPLFRILCFLALFSGNLILSVYLSQPVQAEVVEKKWELKKSENGISVYVRTAENSSFKELKAVTRVKASLSSIVAVLSDWDTYPQWVYRCGSSSTIRKFSDTALIHYQTVTAPWPVEPRDFVVMVQLSQDPLTKVVKQTSTGLPDYIPRKTGMVRITSFRAAWVLTPLGGGMVDIEYQLSVDPGGSVPAWLVNLAVVEGPFSTTGNLVKRIEQPKYKEAKPPFITEL